MKDAMLTVAGKLRYNRKQRPENIGTLDLLCAVRQSLTVEGKRSIVRDLGADS